MSPEMWYRGSGDVAGLRVEDDVITTLDTRSGDVNVLLAESSGVSQEKLDVFRNKIRKIRGKGRAEGELVLTSDSSGQIIFNSCETDEEELRIAQGAFLIINKRDLRGKDGNRT